MKKSKLLKTLLPFSLIGSIIPILATTSCGDASTFNEIDTSGVEKQLEPYISDLETFQSSVEYTGFKVKNNFNVNNLHIDVKYNTQDFGGVITAKIEPTSKQDFNVKVLFISNDFLIKSAYEAIQFSLVFTNKLDTTNVQTIDGLSASFTYGDIHISHSGDTRFQSIVTANDSASYTLHGTFSASSLAGKITDFSNFTITPILTTTTSMTATAEIVPLYDNYFAVQATFNNIEEIKNLTVIYRFTNKKIPDWYQDFTREIKLTHDFNEGFGFSLGLYGQNTARIDSCSIADETFTVPRYLTYQGNQYEIQGIFDNCFQGCYNMKTLNITQYITHLPEKYPLVQGTFLQHLVVDENNPTYTSKDANGNECDCILDKATRTILYAGCSNSKIPTTVTTIQPWAFAGCYSLESLEIPDNVTTIGNTAFNNCYNLKQIKLPSGLTTIESNTFMNCWRLADINIPDTVTTIKNNAFMLTPIKKLHIPANLTTIEDSAFVGCYKLEEITCDTNPNYKAINNCLIDIANKAVKLGCKGSTIPTSASDVTKIANNAFFTSPITSIVIPSNITEIGQQAFAYSSDLTSVKFEGEDVTLDVSVFEECSSLTEVVLPSKLTSIGNRTFAICSSLKAIAIPETVTTIGDEAFIYNSQLHSINMPKALTSIGKTAFGSCVKLQYADLHNITSDSLTIGENAFQFCTMLTDLIFPTKIKSIGAKCFEDCNSLQSVTLPNITDSMGDGCFHSCLKLATVDLAKFTTLTALPARTFEGCASLATVTFGNSSSITNVGQYSFSNCYALSDITLPTNLTIISAYAFRNTGLQAITIPTTVTDIESRAFYNSSLKEATFTKTSGWKNGQTALTTEQVANKEYMASLLRNGNTLTNDGTL